MKTDLRLRAMASWGLLIAFVLLGSSAASSQEHNRAPELTGRYNVIGTNPDGTAYTGTLEVIARGRVYQFRWNAGAQYDGVGIKNGEIIAVAFANGADGKGCGVVDYNILNGVLDGKWGYWGTNEGGTEKAVRISGRHLDGQYDATGTNPDGKRYRVRISIESAGTGYKFTWSNNTEGFGIRRGDNVAVGIGGERCGFVAYEVTANGTLDGIWGGYGTQKTGTEKATKQ